MLTLEETVDNIAFKDFSGNLEKVQESGALGLKI